jgi:predicted MFS family arabinose efflux permease
MDPKKEVNKIGLSVMFVVILGFSANLYFIINPIEEVSISRAFLSIMMVAVGLIPFFGFIRIGVVTKDNNLSKTEIRLAIVVSVITFYLVLVGTASFFVGSTKLLGMSDTMINHFTTIVGVVIAFYFGTAAYEAVNKSKSETEDQKETEGTEN